MASLQKREGRVYIWLQPLPLALLETRRTAARFTRAALLGYLSGAFGGSDPGRPERRLGPIDRLTHWLTVAAMTAVRQPSSSRAATEAKPSGARRSYGSVSFPLGTNHYRKTIRSSNSIGPCDLGRAATPPRCQHARGAHCVAGLAAVWHFRRAPRKKSESQGNPARETLLRKTGCRTHLMASTGRCWRCWLSRLTPCPHGQCGWLKGLRALDAGRAGHAEHAELLHT